MPWQLHLIIQVVLTAIQCLVPAFLPLDPKQDEAVHTFVSAVQGILVMYAHFQDPNTNNVPSPDSPVKPVKPTIQGLS